MTIAESTSYSDAMCGGTLSQHYKFGLVSYRIYTQALSIRLLVAVLANHPTVLFQCFIPPVTLALLLLVWVMSPTTVIYFHARTQ